MSSERPLGSLLHRNRAPAEFRGSHASTNNISSSDLNPGPLPAATSSTSTPTATATATSAGTPTTPNPVRPHPVPPRPSAPVMSTPAWFDSVSAAYLTHSAAPRVNTDLHIARSLRSAFPDKYLAIVPQQTCDLLSFASNGNATCTACSDIGDKNSNLVPLNIPPFHDATERAKLPLGSQTLSHRWKVYVPPEQRLDGQSGELADDVIFDRFAYTWNGVDFVLFVVDGRDGSGAYPAQRTAYVLGPQRDVTDALVLAAAQFQNEVHGAVLIFENGGWTRSKALYESVMRANWDAVILQEDMKAALIEDHAAFFDGRDRYRDLGVPWKRGVIYYGPPGNGKTISIKAMMHTLYTRAKPVPTVYVRNLVTWSGPEAAIKEVFSMARSHAPCYLIFEDIDSLITDGVRSYFLNEVDGLKANDGIFMVASTNHLERLDPGISQRPSRFDRKYLFPNPDEDQRIQYCKYWQHKVRTSHSDVVVFPDALCRAVAGITKDFSYAYMQEAFVAALMAIVRRGDKPPSLQDHMYAMSLATGPESGSDDDSDGWVDVLSAHGWTDNNGRKKSDRESSRDRHELEKNVLWHEMQKQVKILRESMEPEAK